MQFVCSVNDDDYEEMLSYNELMDYIEKDKQQHQDKDGNGFWIFKCIVGHEGPFRASDPEYKGSRYNILVEWENGEIVGRSDTNEGRTLKESHTYEKRPT
jgi:hypothetical protein